MLEKFAAKIPTCVAYDDKLQFYSNLANEVIDDTMLMMFYVQMFPKKNYHWSVYQSYLFMYFSLLIIDVIDYLFIQRKLMEKWTTWKLHRV